MNSLVHRAVLVLAVSVVAGLLLAGLAFPLVGGFGLVAREAADSFVQLPAELADPPPPQRSRILAADGSTLAEVFAENRVVVPLREIPAAMHLAILAIEDDRFYEHGGVDLRGLARAFVKNSQAGEVRQGGSTITQQYVKNVLIETASDAEGKQAATERTNTRKIREARYAIAMEGRYTKAQILEKYLNIAYFGQGVYGVGTAAQHYFSKPVHKLTLPEAALLAGMVRNPTLYNPVKNPKTATNRRNTVLRRMEEVGFLTDHAQVLRAIATPLRVTPSKLTGFTTSRAPYFLDYLLSAIRDDEDGIYRDTFGDTSQLREGKLFRGGLTIHTTLDPNVQVAAQQAIDSTIPRAPAVCNQAKADKIPVGNRCVASAAVVVQPGTGQVRAVAVNRDYARYQVNLATGSGGTGFQAGSTFKMFTLAAALEEGIPLGTRIAAGGTYRPNLDVCNTPERGYFSNADPAEAGVFDIPRATWHSVNTFYVQLQERVGVLKVAAMARKLGVTSLPQHLTRKDCSFTLGVHEVSPLEMASSYATIAGRGRYCRPTPIDRVLDSQGKQIFRGDPACKQVIEQGVADSVTAVLQGVIEHGTGTKADIGRPAAGKTGTTNSFGAAWFIGYTPDYAAAVWMGDTRGLTYELRNVYGVARVYGGSFPATIWRKLMVAITAGKLSVPFPPAPAAAYIGVREAVPDVRGYAREEAVQRLTEAGFRPVVSPQRVHAGPIPAGYVGLTSPPAGSLLVTGSTVIVYLSDGQLPPPTPSPVPTPSPTPGPSTSPAPSPTPTESCKPGNGNNDKCPTPSPS